jgi:hypothetical protein
MWWKFWKRKNKKAMNEPTFPATPSPQIPPGSEPEVAGWLLLASSAKEILGLQQLIGNQAVLRLLAADKARSVSQVRRS